MRITEMSIYKNSIYDLQTNQEKVLNYQSQMSSGKSVNQASDNPAGTIDILRLKEILADSKVQKGNVDDGITWLNTADSALSQLNDTIQRAHDLTIQSANGTYGKDQLKDIASEVDQLLQSTLTTSNTQVNGHYIFGGTKTTIPPYVDNQNGTYTFQGSTGLVYREIAPSTNEAINTTVESVLSGPTGLFNTLVTLKNDLLSGNQSGISSLVGQINNNQVNLQSIQADIGSRTNRLQSSSDNLNSAIVNFTKLLSNVQDVDIAETYTNLNVSQNVYQSSLQTVAKIQQKSLLDYLR